MAFIFLLDAYTRRKLSAVAHADIATVLHILIHVVSIIILLLLLVGHITTRHLLLPLQILLLVLLSHSIEMTGEIREELSTATKSPCTLLEFLVLEGSFICFVTREPVQTWKMDPMATAIREITRETSVQKGEALSVEIPPMFIEAPNVC